MAKALWSGGLTLAPNRTLMLPLVARRKESEEESEGPDVFRTRWIVKGDPLVFFPTKRHAA